MISAPELAYLMCATDEVLLIFSGFAMPSFHTEGRFERLSSRSDGSVSSKSALTADRSFQRVAILSEFSADQLRSTQNGRASDCTEFGKD